MQDEVEDKDYKTEYGLLPMMLNPDEEIVAEEDFDKDPSLDVPPLPNPVGQNSWPFGQKMAMSRIRKSWKYLTLAKRNNEMKA